MEGGVALDGLPVHVGTDLDEVLGDFEMTLVAGYHEAGVAVPVGYLNIWKKGGKEEKVMLWRLQNKLFLTLREIIETLKMQ